MVQCSALLKVAENVHMRNCIMLQLVSLSSLLLAKACCKIFIKYVSTPAIKQMVSVRSLLWVWMHVVDFSLSVISFNACSFLISDFAAAKSELSSCECWVLFIKQLESGRSSQFHLVFFLHFSYIYYMSISCAYVFTGGVNTPTRRGTKKREYVLIKFYRLFNWSLAITVILWLFLSGSGSKQHVLITLPSLTILSMYIISTFKQSTTNIVL